MVVWVVLALEEAQEISTAEMVSQILLNLVAQRSEVEVLTLGLVLLEQALQIATNHGEVQVGVLQHLLRPHHLVGIRLVVEEVAFLIKQIFRKTLTMFGEKN